MITLAEQQIKRLWHIMDQLDFENDEHKRAELIDEAIGLADINSACKREWGYYR